MALTTTMVSAFLKAVAGQYYAEISSSSDKETFANAQDLLTQKQATYPKVANDGAAGDATAETDFFRADQAIRVQTIYWLPSAAVTAHGTNYATLLVASRDGAGGSATNRATFATDTVTTDDLAAHVPKLLSSTEFDLDAGNVLTFEITKAGTGVVVTRGTLIVTYVLR